MVLFRYPAEAIRVTLAIIALVALAIASLLVLVSGGWISWSVGGLFVGGLVAFNRSRT